MNQDEKRTVDALRRAAEEWAVPPSLEPDAMMERLSALVPVAPRRPRRRRWMAAAAAVLAVALGLGAVIGLADPLGLVAVPGEDTPAAPTEPIVFGEAETVRAASSYDEVAACFAAYRERIEAERAEAAEGARAGLFGLDLSASAGGGDDVVMESAAEADTAAIAGGDTDFSGTNVRTEGVDEADVVKTDGTHLYVLADSGRRIAIVSAEEGALETVGSIEAAEGRSIVEFYLEGGRLFAVTTTAWYEADEAPESTELVTFDLSDPSHPVEAGSLAQSGAYRTSRFVDGHLYLFSLFFPSGDPERGDPVALAPTVNGRALDCDDIFLPADDEADGFLVVTAVDADDPTEATAQKGLLHCSGELYVGAEGIYIYEDNYRGKNSATDIVRLAYGAGTVTAGAQATVRGTVNDSFSIDEYDGHLRVVTTIYGEQGQTTNGLFVLDGAMEEVGSIVGLAEGETVRSARFMGDVGYFVTFRQIDPLFTVDLSDPAAPEVVGELKIPGFSAYLHPYGEHRLLGIGWDAGPEGTGAAKLTMFDTTDPADVREAATCVLEGVWTVGALDDYRAALVEPERNLIGFSGFGEKRGSAPLEDDAYQPVVESGEYYYLFSYDEEEGFVQGMEALLADGEGSPVRGVRIGEVLYAASGVAIESFSLQGGDPIAALEL